MVGESRQQGPDLQLCLKSGIKQKEFEDGFGDKDGSFGYIKGPMLQYEDYKCSAH